jgi:hypothetical protein
MQSLYYVSNKIIIFDLKIRESIFTNALLGCKEKMRREKEVRERVGREKNERNRVDLMYGLV